MCSASDIASFRSRVEHNNDKKKQKTNLKKNERILHDVNIHTYIHTFKTNTNSIPEIYYIHWLSHDNEKTHSSLWKVISSQHVNRKKAKCFFCCCWKTQLKIYYHHFRTVSSNGLYTYTMSNVQWTVHVHHMHKYNIRIRQK